MINRIFFITETAIPYGGDFPAAENVHFSLMVNPFKKGDMESAYHLLSNAEQEAGGQQPAAALTLEIRHPLTEENIRCLASFLFIPSYLRIENRRVINLSGDSSELLTDAAAAISVYLAAQGISEVVINAILPCGESPLPNGNWLFLSEEALTRYYTRLLEIEPVHHHELFFLGSSREAFQSALSSLEETETNLEQRSPGLYLLVRINGQLEKELHTLHRKQASLERELEHQKQFVDILRSGHQTNEIQDYYTQEYEILPLWYKRFGHILKVITGKRTLSSLFRDDVKKYKD